VSAPHVVIVRQDFSTFALLQSSIHEVWIATFGAALEDRICYTPSDCLENFPFPAGLETNPVVDAAGREYYEFRAALMGRHNEGLTTTYNRFHDRDEHDAEIRELRRLHAQMDRAVLAAYGWLGKDGETLQPADEESGAALSLRCEFIPDYIEETAEG